MGRDDSLERFERMYLAAGGDPLAISWADLQPSPLLVEWLDSTQLLPPGSRVLVPGCGLGDDAEELCARGFETTGVDISETAINWCQRRWTDTRVTYAVADLTGPPEGYRGVYDAVVEINTLQVLPAASQVRLMVALVRSLVVGGLVFILCRGADEGEQREGWPQPLTRQRLSDLSTSAGLTELSFEDRQDTEVPPVRRFRALYRKTGR